MFNCRKRRRDHEMAKTEDELQFMDIMNRKLMICMYFFYIISMVYGFDSNGNKKEEFPRERKDLERDIFQPLGKYMFRRAYRMRKVTFYKLHSLLKPRLDEVFSPKSGGSRDPQHNLYLV